jgi:predicted nucleotidyltransferase
MNEDLPVPVAQHIEPTLRCLRRRWPPLLAVYLFGSVAQGQAGPQSDVDLALLLPGMAQPLALWDAAEELAALWGCQVDLLDLRAASTVMQYQIITSGRRLWALDAQAALYECFILSEKTALDSARAGLLHDIQQRGSVYGR